MSERFTLHFAADAASAALAQLPGLQGPLDSAASFNAFCQVACRQAAPVGDPVSAQFTALEQQLARGGPETIRTSWGGVVIQRHEPPEVEKYLVIRAGGYLALEKHAEKDEHLEIREGAGLLLWREVPGSSLTVQVLQVGDRFYFPPGVEHCLIGTGHLLVYEQSTDPKGMDQDLIFLYEPTA